MSAKLINGRNVLRNAKRVVVKAGTRVVTRDTGELALTQLFGLIEDVGRVRNSGREIILVSSGAVGLGCAALGYDTTPTELATRQMCAAVGQSRLMAMYREGLAHMGLIAGQVLLTQQDFVEPVRLENLRRTLHTMIQAGIVPIINENDVVSTDELVMKENSFGDNDRLSAMVSSYLGADLLVLLTNVGGVLNDRSEDTETNVISFLQRPEDHHVDQGSSSGGRGGMRSKLDSAGLAAEGGCHVVIASGRHAGVLHRVLDGENVGTWIPARSTP